jgi:hypothetical protein
VSFKRQILINNFVSSIHEGDAALFIGAGMSRPSGYVDWKALLRECARELELDLDQEYDLVAVAQYYLNKRNRDRSRLNQIIQQEFGKPGILSKSHKIIANLPIQTIWTTNFDSLLEDALKAEGKTVDIKSTDMDIATHQKGRDVVLYKMHGDVNRPYEVIICKDDYERYAQKHQVMQNTLEGDLVSKTFLFLGFSFSDPNLEYMLGHLRSLLEDSKREHYAVMRKVRLDRHRDAKTAKRIYEYDLNKQKLQIDDLQRYGIQTHLVDEFGEITTILQSIEKAYYMRDVFVSGSAVEFAQLGEEKVRDFCMQLGEKLIEKGYRLVNGMGLNIGDSVVKGALMKLYENRETMIEKKLKIRPFPRQLPDDRDEEEFYTKYRHDMIKKCGFAIFISGNSRSARSASIGVLNEYEISRKYNIVPIPIGATGYAARRIWGEILPNVESVYSGCVSKGLYERLNDGALSNSELVDAIITIIERIKYS